ncbi:HAD family hydrolase [Salaquimonas pukyongi]|uniref:HAD family hydrolase n=1 Tax=Salaquimonas pukyongi TaxID=2712698 RepID=UPI00096BC130|nr:HAD family phosphatase [Salaquimonas pukyongi]
MTCIRHIVFDIGKVLLHWDPEHIYLERIPDAGKRRWFLENVCSQSWNLDRDLGVSFADGEAELIAQHPGEADNIRAYFAEWPKCIPHVISGVPEIMAGFIDAGHDVTLLTNFSAETFPLAVEKYPFLASARGATVSGEVGIIKPDPKIYRLHETRFALSAQETLYIDDSAANIDAACRHGWHGIVFSNAKQLRTELAAFDLV